MLFTHADIRRASWETVPHKTPNPRWGGVGLIFCYYFSRHFPDFWNPNPARTLTPPPPGVGWVKTHAGYASVALETIWLHEPSRSPVVASNRSSSNSSWLPQNSSFFTVQQTQYTLICFVDRQQYYSVWFFYNTTTYLSERTAHGPRSCFAWVSLPPSSQWESLHTWPIRLRLSTVSATHQNGSGFCQL